MKNLILIFALLFPTLAFAQTSRNPCYTTQGQSGTIPNCIGVGTATPLPVTSTPSAGVGPATTANSQSIIQNSQYPANSVGGPAPVASAADGTTGAVSVSLAATASTTAYICGFNVSAVGGTATVGPIAVSGLLGGTQRYEMNSAATPVMLSQSFSPCIPASAVNTPIGVTTVANGTATAVHVNAWGYRL